LRADPLGAKALYSSYARLAEVNTLRLYEPLRNLGSGKNRTLYLLGTSDSAFQEAPETDFNELDQFLRSGGRVVVAFLPETTRNTFSHRSQPHVTPDSKKQKKPQDKDAAKPQNKTGQDRSQEDQPDAVPSVSLGEKWGFTFKFETLTFNKDGQIEPASVMRAGNEDLPETLAWRSGMYFGEMSNAWRVIYTRKKLPVLIERNVGAGALVLASDAYLLSNEALRKDRQPRLLAWLNGSSRELIFDETHLGVESTPSVTMLMRRYHLMGLVGALALIAVLFAWKNATSFMPPPTTSSQANPETNLILGKENSQGLANLLRRNIRAKDILSSCIEEWAKFSSSANRAEDIKKQQALSLAAQEAALPTREQNPARAYRAIAQLLNKRK